MKKHLSCFMLPARSTIYKMLLLIAAMAAVEITVFYFVLRANPQDSLETLLVKSYVHLIFSVTFLLLMALFCATGSEYGGSRVRYTIARLSVSERVLVLWWALYYTLAILIFWAAQTLIAVALCRIYERLAAGALVGGQTVFLTFYRYNFFHSLLPLAEWGRYVRNVLLALSLGVGCACFSFRRRRDQSGVAAVVLAALTVLSFPAHMGATELDVIIPLLSLVVAGSALIGVWGFKENENEEA